MNYDPDKSPDPTAWLETDEGERLIMIERFHRRQREAAPSPKLHALMHLVVENQLAMPDQAAVQDALARLLNQGLQRHDAIHAIGSVLAQHLFAAMQDTPRGPDPNATYDAALNELTAARWRASIGPGFPHEDM